MEPLIPIAAVEGLMVKAFVEQTVAPGLFWDALLKCHLYVPVSQKGEEANDDEIPVLLGVGSDGGLVIWIFTSPDAMTTYTERELSYRELAAQSLFQSVVDSEHAIVLIGPDGLTLSLHPDLVATLAEGKVPEPLEETVKSVSKDAKVFVGSPPPDDTKELEARFTTLFESLPQVLEATFIQVADDAGSRLLLGLRLVDGTQEALREIAGAVAQAAEGVLEKGKTMDITLIDRSLKGAFEKWGKPFFKRP